MLLSGLAWAGLAVWIYLAAGRGGFWRAVEDRLPAVAPAKSVAVVIPARNEALMIGRAVASLARQDYQGPLRIIVVDDNSADRTASQARGAALDVQIMHGRPLPAGWTGKMWAVSQGVERAGVDPPDYLLLTDADIVHSRDHIRRLVAAAEKHGLDLVSHMVLLRCRSGAAQLLIPAFVFFFLMLYPKKWTGDPRRRTAAAAGGSILVRRTALERIGGIAAIRNELIDDCALAARVKASGGRIRLGLTRKSRSVRIYAGFGEIWRMISRTAFTQLGHSAALLAGTVAAMLVIFVAPPVCALAGGKLASFVGFAAWMLMSLLYAPMLVFYRRSVLWAPLLPLVALFYLGATVNSAIQSWAGRGGAWKGRIQDQGSASERVEGTGL
ncbi:MAG: glycosyltransferase [Acidobacteria bacterium]|nr:glycosyltransferase [Acidobacteriota bacterium]